MTSVVTQQRPLAVRVWGQRFRFSLFAINSMSVFATGLLIQVLLVRYEGMGHVSSYIVQIVASVLMSFLPSRFLTWRDRDVAILPALARFNVQQLAVAGLGVAGYAGLEHLGVNYIMANVSVTAALTPVSFLSSHVWSLTEPRTKQATTYQSWLSTAVGDVIAVPWPLFAVLGVQAILSLRLIWSTTAFLDEATYIWAGRIELWHLTGGMHVPAYATYFSGAPVIYPPLAGLADIVGGLPAARLLSLAFMLGATCTLWASTHRLFGRRAALCAVAMFASIGSTQFLGALATYDAMALFLLTLSAWLVIVVRDRDDSTPLLLVAVVALALANATKYATGLFDPVIVALAILTSTRGVKAGIGRAGLIAGCTVGLIAALLAVGGSWYLAGLQDTTLSRAAGGQSPALVLQDSARWIGVVILIAAVGVAVAWWCNRKQTLLVALLAIAGILAPVNQARIHTTMSLEKHVDFGAWFMCIAAGYAVATVVRMGRAHWFNGAAAIAVAGLILLPGGVVGRAQAYAFSQAWPNSTEVTSDLRVLTRTHPGTYLGEDFVVPAYYLENQIPWQSWAGTWYFQYRAPGSIACVGGSSSSAIGPTSGIVRAFDGAVAHRYFALIILDFSDTVGVDDAITSAIHRDGTYHVIAELPYWDEWGKGQYTVWAPTATIKEIRHGSSC